MALVGFASVSHAQLGGGSGWTPQTVSFHVQSPFNLPVSDRYTFIDGVYHMWVFSTDDPFAPGNTTRPRTEQRYDPDYTSGEMQYQGMLQAPANENSYCIFQIHTGDAQSPKFGATTFMLFWFSSDGGSVHDYAGQELAGNLGGQWFQLNVDHNVTTHTITVWINGAQVWQQKDNGATDFYFKNGVYEQNHSPTLRMDAYVKDVQIWARSGVATFPLTVALAGSGSGTVTSAPAGITCGTACSASFDSGTTVTLTATAAAESEFAGWGSPCSGTGTCKVTVSAASTVTATFTAMPPEFSLAVSPATATVTAGGTAATYTATVTGLNGFTGTVDFSVTGLPSGATDTFTPASVVGSGPSTLSIPTTTATPAGTFPLTVTGASGTLSHTAPVSLTVKAAAPPPPTCLSVAAGKGWTNTPFAAQTGTFTATYDATPSAQPTNDVIGLSDGAQTNIAEFPVLVSFSSSGDIVARNGDAYSATNTVPYKAGVSYHFTLTVNVAKGTYTAQVTPAGGTQVTVASNFAFRTGVTAKTLNSVGSNVDTTTGTFTYCNFAVQ